MAPKHDFRPVSRLSLRHIDDMLAQVQSILATQAIPQAPAETRRTREAMKKLSYEHHQWDQPLSVPELGRGQVDAFRYLWARHHPVAVVEVQLQGDWSPAAFVKSHGCVEVSVIDSSCTRPVRTNVADFFAAFVSVPDLMAERRVVKLKVI